MFTSADTYADHIADPRGLGCTFERAHIGRAGGASCGNTLEFRVQVTGDRVTAAGFSAEGCRALTAAASMAVELVEGEHVFDAARLSAATVIKELGLTSAKAHVAPLVEDALHVALGRACHADADVAPDPLRTLVAMSGGVDSSVVAWLETDSGRQPVAVTLELWRDDQNDSEKSCCSASAVRAARAQAHKLGLAHFTLDLREEFAAGVVAPFLDAHRRAETPNPCVACNGDVRLDAMLDLATRLGADGLATGHYARTVDDGFGPLLQAAADPAKDQTYMLARLSAASLARMKFPLGDLQKTQTRELATRAGLVAADKPDSQDLCFLAGTDKRSFLARHGSIADRPGDIVTRDGRVLGQHTGVHAYTIGQRKGLGVNLDGQPLYVLALDADKRQVVVGPRDALKAVDVPLRGVRLHRPADRVTHIRLRYHAAAVEAALPQAEPGNHSRMTATLADPADEVAPGQSAQLLCGDIVVGQATIGR